MSIVNDALKKAKKEFHMPYSSKKTVETIIQNNQPIIHTYSKRQGLRWPPILLISLVALISILGSLFLYKSMTEVSSPADINKPNPEINAALKEVEQRNIFSAMKNEGIVKLSGIVYGEKEKWAIVNNKIIREGDVFLGGEVISITPDLVKIKKKDGNETILTLK